MTTPSKLREQSGVLLYEPVTLSLASSPEQALAALWGLTPGVLLAHASDGLIWGRFDNGTLTLAREAHPNVGARLLWHSLLDLRIFGADSELRIWRTGGELKALRMVEELAPSEAALPKTSLPFDAWLERRYWMLGAQDPGTPNANEGFTLLHGRGGQRHAPPNLQAGDVELPFRLRVRHYYGIDADSGMYRLIEHRYCYPAEEKTP